MNIRKKILCNPTHLKYAKPDLSDNTTAHTKNSAILEQSKTFRLTNNTPFSTQRSKNYLRTLSKQVKKQNSAHIQNVATSLVKKPHLMPSFSTLSNQNLPPLKKGILKRKFLLEPQELPQLTSQKRPIILSSQYERKPPSFPSSHTNSNKDLYNPNSLSRKQFHGHGKIPINRILGNDIESIQRRKQQLNSMNVGSFYTTQKSIALSKFSMGSRKSSRNENLSKNSDKLSIQKQKKASQFVQQNKQQDLQETEILPQQQVSQSMMQESIVQEIERNKSVLKEEKKSFMQENKNKKIEKDFDNEQDTIKSSLYESKTVEVKVVKESNNKVDRSSLQESSLCESQQIESEKVQQKKNTYRLMGSQSRKFSQKKYSFDKDEDFCLQTLKSLQQQQQQKNSKQSSFCESYQIQTPNKPSKQ